MSDHEDSLVFSDESTVSATRPIAPWRILVVDDDADVHEATRFALGDAIILNRPLLLLHAVTSKEALDILRTNDDIAVVLLDVVMESDDAGLKTVEAIRAELKLANVRIILRTGQPGQAPEVDTVTRYDINDYKTKTELTQTKLFTTLTAAIRSYDQLQRLDANRQGLEKIVAASNQFIAEQGLQSFAEGVITQIAGLIGVQSDGLVCAAAEDSAEPGVPAEFRVIAAAGQFKHLIQHRLRDITDQHIVTQLTKALETKQSIIQPENVTLYFRKTPEEGFAAFIDSVIPIRDVDQELLEVFCTNIALCAKNIDLVAELRRDAFFDRQLNLPNRTALVCDLNKRIAFRRHRHCTLAIVDVDQFSTANDVLGHDYGDALLKMTARRLKDGLPADAFIARLSGDAFAVVGPGDSLTPEAIQNCFAQPFDIDGGAHPVSASVGIAHMDTNHHSAIEYLKDAYLALKRAKSLGLSQSVIYSEAMGQEARGRSVLLRELRLAFGQEQLSLAFQPQIDLATGEIMGVEALMRWRRDDGQFISPDRFIPIAEQSGLIVGMGNWILQEALLSLKRFQDAGFPDLRMAVNISPVQLRQHDFLEQVSEALCETQSRPSDLELEITESVAVGGIEPIIELLNRLRATGVTVAIDDFGTGYSSLSYLDKLPADRLKIDRSFITALERNDHGSRIARTIIVLGRELGLRVIAEGVENETAQRFVTELGCHEAQGYHIARPMLEDQFIDWLMKHKEERS